MEFLNVIQEGVTNVVAGNYITTGVLVAPFILPNVLVEKVCYGLGVTVSKILRQKVGAEGEKVEKYFQGTINAAVRGLNSGLDADD